MEPYAFLLPLGSEQWIFPERTFTEFLQQIEKQFETGCSAFTWHGPYFGCADYLVGEDGRIIVDTIIRFEDRERGIEFLTKQLGIQGIGNSFVNSHTPLERHYSEFYDDVGREIIQRVYHQDIELFNYEFEQAG